MKEDFQNSQQGTGGAENKGERCSDERKNQTANLPLMKKIE